MPLILKTLKEIRAEVWGENGEYCAMCPHLEKERCLLFAGKDWHKRKLEHDGRGTLRDPRCIIYFSKPKHEEAPDGPVL